MSTVVDTELSAYDIGWTLGYNDTCPSDGICPFRKDTEEYNEFWKGYEDGAWEC